jgi:Kef-type K+ transport system membrane component KefB
MTEVHEDYWQFMLLLGAIAMLSLPLRRMLAAAGLPALVAFIGLGIALSGADRSLGFMTTRLEDGIGLMAQIGLVALLFRIGLESDLGRLAGQLFRAVRIWGPDMAVAAALAFALIWAWPGLGVIPALLTGLAASATSIGISLTPWEEAEALQTEDGALLLDVAELDDLSAVVLLAVVFAVVPNLQGDSPMIGEAFWIGALQLVKIAAFSTGCFAFSRFLEPKLSGFFERLNSDTGPFIFAAGTVFVIAGLADLLGFSMAIGAIFAGFAFNRDPQEGSIDNAFSYVLALFGPFFFLSIGLSVGFEDFGAALMLAAALFAVFVLGKLLGAGLAASAVAGKQTGLLIGTSMVPRAEISLVIMAQGLSLGSWAVPTVLYTATVLAAVATCVTAPPAVAWLLASKQQEGQTT